MPLRTILGTAGSASTATLINTGPVEFDNTVTFVGNPVFSSTTPIAFPAGVSGTVTYTGDQFFKSGRPWIDVRAYGAKGDGATDDTTSCQNAITAATSGQIVYFPPGSYKVGALTVSNTGVRLVGAGSDSSVLIANTANVTVVTLSAVRATVEHLGIQNNNFTTTTTNPLISVGSATECKVLFCLLTGGTNAISCAQSSDVVIAFTKAYNSYGGAIVYFGANSGTTGAAFLYRNKLDQSFPVSLPAQGTSPAAWVNATVYTAGTVVSTQGYYIQCKTGGTSGAGAPTLQPYGTDITDNTVTWRLVSKTTYYAIQVDTGASNIFVIHTDMTGSFQAGVGLTNTLSGTVPSIVVVRDSTIGQCWQAGVHAVAGNTLLVEGNQLDFTLFTGAPGCFLTSTWGSDAVIRGNYCTRSPYGVYIGGGTNAVVANNLIGGSTTAGIFVDVAVSYFTIIGNSAGTSAKWGINAIGIRVASGASSNYAIEGNILTGATTPLQDQGTGANKRVMGNIGVADQVTTKKVGTGAGNYTTTSTSLVDVDATNLAYTVTVPQGSNLTVSAAGAGQSTVINGLFVALAVDGTAVQTVAVAQGVTSNQDAFALQWLIAGDGASHTIKLQYAVGAAGTATITNASGGANIPVMVFALMASS